MREAFRFDVFEALKPLAKKHNLKLKTNNSVNDKRSQIYLNPIYSKRPIIVFGIESFSGDPNDSEGGFIFCGICVHGGCQKMAEELYSSPKSLYWSIYQRIRMEDNLFLNLSAINQLKKLNTPCMKNTIEKISYSHG